MNRLFKRTLDCNNTCHHTGLPDERLTTKLFLPESQSKELAEMLAQEGLEEMGLSSPSEQVAYLLVERATLLERLGAAERTLESQSLADNSKQVQHQVKFWSAYWLCGSFSPWNLRLPAKSASLRSCSLFMNLSEPNQSKTNIETVWTLRRESLLTKEQSCCNFGLAELQISGFMETRSQILPGHSCIHVGPSFHQCSSQSPLKKLFGLRRSGQSKHTVTPVGSRLAAYTN